MHIWRVMGLWQRRHAYKDCSRWAMEASSRVKTLSPDKYNLFRLNDVMIRHL